VVRRVILRVCWLVGRMLDDRSIDAALVDPCTYADEARYHGLFGHLRRADPVHWAQPEGHRPFWTLSKHADIVEVARQNRLFLSGGAGNLLSAAETRAIGAIPGFFSYERSILMMDEPEHRTYRHLTQSWFTPGNMARLKADITRLAHAAVDGMAEFGGACDFVNDVAAAFPLRVIMRIFGLPPEDDPYVRDLTRRIFAASDADYGAGSETGPGTRLTRNMTDYFASITSERRRRPGDDLASLIANARIDGAPIGDIEAAAHYLLILTAGHYTTTAALTGGLLALLRNPAEMQKLRGHDALLPGAVREMIRFVTPITHMFRVAGEQYELRGRHMRPGDPVMLCFPSANRDEDVFADPSAFRIDRPGAPHVAFGYGAHVCLGQHLTTLEMQIFFAVLLGRVKQMELAAEPAYTRSTFVSGLKRLPIRFQM